MDWTAADRPHGLLLPLVCPAFASLNRRLATNLLYVQEEETRGGKNKNQFHQSIHRWKLKVELSIINLLANCSIWTFMRLMMVIVRLCFGWLALPYPTFMAAGPACTANHQRSAKHVCTSFIAGTICMVKHFCHLIWPFSLYPS